MPTSTAAAIGLPFTEAIDFFRGKARVPTQAWYDVWRTAHSHSFMVAGAATDALLSDFQTAIQKALDKGTTLAEFRTDFDAIVARHGWEYNGTPGWRSRIIYETNLSTAYSAGRYTQLTQPETLAAFPYWRYVHSGARHPRLQHLAWNGLTLRADDPFWATHYPPNGWRCGCRVSPTSEGGLERMGKSKPDTAPPLETREWRNPKTGEVHDVPIGIDPGFDYNPGQAWKDGGKHIPVKAPDLVPVAGSPAAPPPPPPASEADIRAFVQDPKGEINLGDLAEAARKDLGAQTRAVRLSADTMDKQLEHHPELTGHDYARLPEIVSRPDLTIAHQDQRVLLLRPAAADGKRALRKGMMLAAVVKTTADQTVNYLVSLYLARAKTVANMVRRGRVIDGDVPQPAKDDSDEDDSDEDGSDEDGMKE